MTSGNSVDAIWQQLKQQEYKSKDTRLESLWKHVQGGTCSKQPISSKPACFKQLVPQQQQQKLANSISPQTDNSDAIKTCLQDASAVSQLTLALQSPDGSTVKAALQQLQVGA